eukprot:Skav227136  [mRNA]  locus=scaffold133:453575:457355:- [translate_table: standard]
MLAGSEASWDVAPGAAVRFAPFGAFGAMAHTVGKYGISTLGSRGAVLLLVLATSSSESALPSLMERLQDRLQGPVAGNIYMTLTTLFISQCMGVDLSWADKLKASRSTSCWSSLEGHEWF